jgi:hypothetical protein
MLVPDWIEVFDSLSQYLEALLKNRIAQFANLDPDSRAFKAECARRALFNIQNFLIPAANSGTSRTTENLNRVNDTVTQIFNSGYFTWN